MKEKTNYERAIEAIKTFFFHVGLVFAIVVVAGACLEHQRKREKLEWIEQLRSKPMVPANLRGASKKEREHAEAEAAKAIEAEKHSAVGRRVGRVQETRRSGVATPTPRK